MSRKDWNRHGSPYDPNHRGRNKVKRDLEPDLGTGGSDTPSESYFIPGTITFIRGKPGGSMHFELSRLFDSTHFDGESTSNYRDNGRLMQELREARSAVEKWLTTAPDQSFDDIVGNEDALEQLRDAIQAPVTHKALYEAYGMKMPKGALLSGPPGCGKTMFARAAASEMKRLYGAKSKVEFISISGAELQSKYVGETERYIKAIFTYARLYRQAYGHPLLVFLDEAEVLLPDRTSRVRPVYPWEESQVATFLAEMDGMHESGAFVLLATNRPEVIDQAVLRDGRCDFKIVVRRPTMAAIEVIVRNNLMKCLLHDELEDLVFAAVESLFDPHKIILDATGVIMQLELTSDGIEQSEIKRLNKHFLLEHIISGAMGASIGQRSTRYAFSRDKATGKATGIKVSDVVESVNDLFKENKELDHTFALDEFREEFQKEFNTLVNQVKETEERKTKRK